MFFGKTCLSSKSSSGNVDSRSDNAPDNFPPKVRFFHKNLKNSPPPPRPCPPFWKNYQTEHFSGDKNFSRRSVSGQKKTQFWQSAFKVQKTSAECLEKALKTLISNKKEDRLPKNPPRFASSSFDNHAETFQKQYIFLFPIFTKTDCSISEKSIQLPKIFQVKKSP